VTISGRPPHSSGMLRPCPPPTYAQWASPAAARRMALPLTRCCIHTIMLRCRQRHPPAAAGSHHGSCQPHDLRHWLRLPLRTGMGAQPLTSERVQSWCSTQFCPLVEVDQVVIVGDSTVPCVAYPMAGAKRVSVLTYSTTGSHTRHVTEAAGIRDAADGAG
jgi:hypothetical protein